MLLSKALYVSHPCRASFGNHSLGERRPLWCPCLGLQQDQGVWPWIQRLPQPALPGHQVNGKQPPKTLMIQSDFDMFIEKYFALICAIFPHCFSRLQVPSKPTANVFDTSEGSWRGSDLSRTGSLEMQSYEFLLIISVEFCLTPVWFSCSVVHWSLKSQYYFSFCTSGITSLGCFPKHI